MKDNKGRLFMTLKESFAYIEKECKKFDLTLNTSDKKIEEYYITLTGLDNEENEMNIDSKRIYLYDYLITDMIRNDEITFEQGNQYLNYIDQKCRSKNQVERER